MKIRLLFVIENETFGGGERAFSRLINGLDPERFLICAACRPQGSFVDEISGRAKILPLDLGSRFNIASAFRLAALIKAEKIDIVHSQGARADFYAALASRLSGARHIVTVAMPVEGFNVGRIRKKLYLFFSQFAESSACKFITVSGHLGNYLASKRGVHRGKIEVIYNAVAPQGIAGGRFREKTGSGKLIVAVGRLVWQKGFGDLLKAASIMLSRPMSGAESPKFVIVGEGPQESELGRIAMTLGIASKIIFTGFRSDAADIISSADVFVMPSLAEGQPIALLEAMAAGRPIVASSLPGIQETVRDGVEAILVPPARPELLASAITRLIEDRELGAKLGSAAAARAVRDFSLKSYIDRHERLYDGLMAGHIESNPEAPGGAPV